MTDTKIFTDERIKRFAEEYASLILQHFFRTIEEKFHGNFDSYKKLRKKYALLLGKAQKSPLDIEELKALKCCRLALTKSFELPKSLSLSLYCKETKKMKKVPFKVLKWMISTVSDGAFRIMNHGRDAYGKFEFKNYYTVKFSEIDNLASLYKKKGRQNENAA